jgi:hypothetical protein
MTRFGKNLMSLSFEVILALLGLGLSAWYLTETSIAYDVSKCSDKVKLILYANKVPSKSPSLLLCLHSPLECLHGVSVAK